MFKKLKEIFYKPIPPPTPVRVEHLEGDPSGFIVIWSDDKNIKLATIPDKIHHDQLNRLLKQNNYNPVEYFVST